MKIYISAEQYFAAYPRHPAITAEIRANADAMLRKVNAVMEMMEEAGVTFEMNRHEETPHFGSFISGMGNGGWRPPECAIGAPASRHKRGKAVDVKDADGQADRWCDANEAELRTLGMAREAPSETVGWCHLQDGAPPSGHVTFMP